MTSMIVMAFESLFDFAMHKYENEMPHTYHTREFAKRTGPKPLVSPYNKMFNAHYDMHPELTRPGGPGVYVAAGTMAYVGIPVGLAAANYAIIEQDVPEEERSGFWQMYSSALTGTFGGGFTGIV